jgi:hypothetical protein
MRSTRSFVTLRRRALLGATAITAALTAAASAQAEGTANMAASEDLPGIIVRDDLSPGNVLPPAGVISPGITGVGMMSVSTSPTTTGFGSCTGTLINPRTVLFAAHCVNSRPAEAYGPNGIANGPHLNGTPIAFGFNSDNFSALLSWFGLGANPALKYQTNVAQNLYAAEQVWYDPRSLGPNSATFLEADIAIATLDTPALDIPTWTMLFSPLDGPTHATITGYGRIGTNASVLATGNTSASDFRRRAAENMVMALASNDDMDGALYGLDHPVVQSVYRLSFSDPNRAFDPSANKFDWGIFGPNDVALPREATTGPGDSGSPLIIDEKYDRAVVAGVLSGGSRYFFNPDETLRSPPFFLPLLFPPFSAYGTTSFYQPLFLFWDQIVANNPYVYATNKGGDGNWTDPGHWIQAMDPSYMIDLNGQLINSLPDTPATGTAVNPNKFGTICNLTTCTDVTSSGPTGDGTPVFVEGGPGSTNFVPNNVRANPKAGVRARYYDVTLSAAGTTTLGSSVTIDKLTLDGPTKLDVKSAGGALNVLGEYTQWAGWTNVDGLISSGGDTLIATGLLSGSGRLKAPFVTVAAAIVAPGGADTLGVLTVDGNAILSSGSALFIDASRAGADKLAVTGSLLLSQNDQGQGPTLVMNKATGAAPRHGQSFTIAESAMLTGTFGQIFSFQGVLRPELSYTSTSVIANLRAGSLADQLGQSSPTERAFAVALDQLRGSSYNSLFGLYGAVDLMDGAALSRTLAGLAPTAIAIETLTFQEKQSKLMLSAVGDRLSSLGTAGSRGTLSIVGSPETVLASSGSPTGLGSTWLAGVGGSRSFTGGERVARALPETMSGFIAGGVSSSASSFGNNRMEVAGQRSWNVGMGLEMEVAEGTTLGTAFALSNGLALPGGERARVDSRAAQAAVYGSYQLGGGAYVAGLAAAERSRTGIEREAFTGDAVNALTGATETARYSAMLETGVNFGVAKGLTLTPRASLGYSSYQLSGFRESGGEAALRLDDLELNRLDAKVGAKFAGTAPLGRSGWTLVPQIQADWVQNLSGARSGMTVRFASAPDVAIALPLLDGDTSWAEVKGGMRLTNGALEFGAGIEGSFGRQSFRDERAVADVTLRF